MSLSIVNPVDKHLIYLGGLTDWQQFTQSPVHSPASLHMPALSPSSNAFEGGSVAGVGGGEWRMVVIVEQNEMNRSSTFPGMLVLLMPTWWAI